MSTSTANRAIKARPKASPDRIQSDVINTNAIVDRVIVDNTLHHVAESEELQLSNLPDGDISVPLAFWLEHKSELQQRPGLVAVQIAADEVAADIVEDLNHSSLLKIFSRICC